MRWAFKEWAIVVDALGRGEQTIILRKGGIAEGRGGFQVEQPKFWLFPTLFHQQRESVLESAAARYPSVVSRLPKDDVLQLEFMAEVVKWQRLESLEAARRLKGQHIWRDEVIAERFEWGRGKSIFALAVRAYRVPKPIQLPMRPEYGGCKSWMELDQDVEPAGAMPVLADPEFAHELARFEGVLAGK